MCDIFVLFLPDDHCDIRQWLCELRVDQALGENDAGAMHLWAAMARGESHHHDNFFLLLTHSRMNSIITENALQIIFWT